jgi:V/A-type H+-transporting ATPase subunit K
MTIGRSLAWWVIIGVVLTMLLTPAIALGQEEQGGGEQEVRPEPGTWDMGLMALAAGLAMGLSALGAGYAQARIGAAAAGAVAERPETFVNVIVFLVLPEIIVLLGFVVALMLGP